MPTDTSRSCDTGSKAYITKAENEPVPEYMRGTKEMVPELRIALHPQSKETSKAHPTDVRTLVATTHSGEDFVAPSAKIILLLKQLRGFASNEDEKSTLDRAILQILNGTLYQTLLRTPRTCDERCKSAGPSPQEDRKTSMIPWMENFSSPEMDPQTIKMCKERGTTPKLRPRKIGRHSVFAQSLSRDVLDLLQAHIILEQGADSISFDIFEFEKLVGRKRLLPSVAYFILQKNNAFDYIDEEMFENFIGKIRDGYRTANPYHNDMHAADVLQMCSFMLAHGLREVAQLTDLDVSALLLSAIIHDFKHPGVNNAFLQNTRSDLALIYNDQSILENFHLSEAFALIWRDKKCDIFKKLAPEEKKLVRKIMAGCVLGTDTAHHFEHLNTLQNLIAAHEISRGSNSPCIINRTNDVTEFESKQEVLVACLHAADISNSTRPLGVAAEWARRVTSEFYLQGDREKMQGLAVSAFCDREKGDLASSQVGFISGIIRPYMERVVEIFPDMQVMLDNANNGLAEWQKTSATATTDTIKPQSNKA